MSNIPTKQLEHAIFFGLRKMGTYLCFEVAMPTEYRGMNHKERVDLLSYDTRNKWRFYELKVSKADFYSKAKKTFLGHYNYFVMPHELYELVKQDIPKHIGVYTTCNGGYCSCKKRAVYQDLQVDHDKLMFSFMQALSREHEKYRKLLKQGVV